MAEWIYFIYAPRENFAETMTNLRRAGPLDLHRVAAVDRDVDGIRLTAARPAAASRLR